MRTRVFLCVTITLLLATSLGLAGEAMKAPEPTPGHDVLAAWIGKWSGSGELKESPFFPGGTMTWTEECQWFGGSKFNVVCKSKGSGPMGEVKGLGVVGFKPETGEYVHFGIDSNGWMGHALGERDGKRYTFVSKDKMGGKIIHSRMVLVLDDAETMSFSWEISEDGTNWTMLIEGISKKQ